MALILYYSSKVLTLNWFSKGDAMLYVNVPLPKPLVDKIDQIIADESNSFRSRPDFILQHIRDIVEKEIEKKRLLPE